MVPAVLRKTDQSANGKPAPPFRSGPQRHILAQNKNAVAKISASCTKEEMLSLQYEDPEGKKPKLPLRAGAGGLGTLQLYHRVAGGRQLLDTLKLEDALCIYQHEQESPKSCD